MNSSSANPDNVKTSSMSATIKQVASSLNLSGKGDPYTWKELKRKDDRRRKILKQSEEPYCRILFHRKGTCLATVIQDPLFWITVIIYIGVRIQARRGLPDYVSDLVSAGDIAVIGGFLSFFLVFFVNQNHRRFVSLYDKSMACKGRIMDAATLVATYLHVQQDTASRLIRYMNAAHVAAYVGLSETYPGLTFFTHVNDSFGLLTEKELKRLHEMGLYKDVNKPKIAYSAELTTWAAMEACRAHRGGLLDNELAAQLRQQILELRANISAIYNAADLPVPFFYVHFICLLTALYLPLFAVSAAYNAGTGQDVYWTADVVAGLVVVLQAIFVIGLRVLGQKMSDPYGDDLVDLSVIHYVTATWMGSNRILETEFPKDTTSIDEESLRQSRQSKIGEPWEAKDDVQLGTSTTMDSSQVAATGSSDTIPESPPKIGFDDSVRC